MTRAYMNESNLLDYLLREGGPLYLVLGLLIFIIKTIIGRLDSAEDKQEKTEERVDEIYDKYEDCMNKRVEDAKKNASNRD